MSKQRSLIVSESRLFGWERCPEGNLYPGRDVGEGRKQKGGDKTTGSTHIEA
jgi:hypothetical protein